MNYKTAREALETFMNSDPEHSLQLPLLNRALRALGALPKGLQGGFMKLVYDVILIVKPDRFWAVIPKTPEEYTGALHASLAKSQILRARYLHAAMTPKLHPDPPPEGLSSYARFLHTVLSTSDDSNEQRYARFLRAVLLVPFMESGTIISADTLASFAGDSDVVRGAQHAITPIDTPLVADDWVVCAQLFHVLTVNGSDVAMQSVSAFLDRVVPLLRDSPRVTRMFALRCDPSRSQSHAALHARLVHRGE